MMGLHIGTKSSMKSRSRKSDGFFNPSFMRGLLHESLEERRVFAVDSSFLGSVSLVTLADVNASAINGSQTESHISVNPTAPGNVVTMANGGLSSDQFTAFSTNAGTTFTASPVGNALDGQGGGSRFDGATATDRFGNVHLVYMARPSGGNSAIVQWPTVQMVERLTLS